MGSSGSATKSKSCPAGLRARVRGMQTHKSAVEVGLPGSRLAINLTGVHPEDLRRGMVVARPGCAATHGAGRRPAAPRTRATTGRSDSSTATRSTSSAARPKCRPACGCWTPKNSRPGESGWAQLVLEAPVALAPGRPLHRAPAIAQPDSRRRRRRQPAPCTTLAPLPARRHRSARNARAWHARRPAPACPCADRARSAARRRRRVGPGCRNGRTSRWPAC